MGLRLLDSKHPPRNSVNHYGPCKDAEKEKTTDNGFAGHSYHHSQLSNSLPQPLVLFITHTFYALLSLGFSQVNVLYSEILQ